MPIPENTDPVAALPPILPIDLDEPRILHVNRWMILLYCFGGLVFAGISFAFSLRRGFWSVLGPVFGWLVLVVTLLTAVQLLPGSSYVRLTRDGFVLLKTFRRRAYSWHDVGRFSTMVPGYNITGQPLTTYVVFKITRGPKMGRRVVVSATPIRGWNPHRLADLMNAWRHEALHGRSGQDISAS